MYNLKDIVSPPDGYLGANVEKWQFLDGSNCWCMKSRDYIANEINLDKHILEQKGKVFMYGKRAKRPIQMSYRP